MRQLDQVIMVCVDCVNYGGAINAIVKSLNEIKPVRTIFLTDLEIKSDLFETHVIEKITSKQAYSQFIVKQLNGYLHGGSHVLIIQADGYVLNGDIWTDDFLTYDYIGAKWRYSDSNNVGNGGFSLRSLNLMLKLTSDDRVKITHPEDEITCRLYGDTLGVKFASEDVADRFSYEMNPPDQKTFGFHQYYHSSFRTPVVLHREGAMGDIIMLEPVMEWMDKKGWQVYLDIPIHLMSLFEHLPYNVRHISVMVSKELPAGFDFDMAYEKTPKQLVLKSYYEHVGITDGELRNSNLNFYTQERSKLFRKYAVVHINHTDMPYRNIYGVEWDVVERYLKSNGFEVIQIGDDSEKCGTWTNTADLKMLMYVIGGAALFIGSDSGPAHIAVACKIPSVLFFGSVTPEYRFADLSYIEVVQQRCPKAGCYHSIVGVSGIKCLLEENPPHCSVHTTEQVLNTIHKIINKPTKMAYYSESEKIRDTISKYLTGKIMDIGCGTHKVVPEAVGVDGRDVPGIDISTDDLYNLSKLAGKGAYNTVFSSHCLEHIEDDTAALKDWATILKPGGHLVLYLPDGRKYSNEGNEYHVRDYNYQNFMFFFNRVFCGKLKGFTGEFVPPIFELVESGEHFGDDLYSFYVVAKKL